MRFAVFTPPQAQNGPVPVLYWLSGLTCTEENFTVKAGAFQHAAMHGLMVVAPDTSPRGLGIPGEDDDWDFGSGAGFYVDALKRPWSPNYAMFSYVTEELPNLIEAHFPAIPGKAGISGHSMGGHGALVAGLRRPERFQSISAFAPICAPSQCPWGIKAFSNYLGEDRDIWAQYDAHCLLQGELNPPPLFIDQGSEDGFLEEQLYPHLLREVCERKGHQLNLRMQEGYDHGYFFVTTFIRDHMAHHADALLA